MFLSCFSICHVHPERSQLLDQFWHPVLSPSLQRVASSSAVSEKLRFGATICVHQKGEGWAHPQCAAAAISTVCYRVECSSQEWGRRMGPSTWALWLSRLKHLSSKLGILRSNPSSVFFHLSPQCKLSYHRNGIDPGVDRCSISPPLGTLIDSSCCCSI